MDGTLINSIASAERIWSAWATRHGVDVASFLPTVHGVRTVETINRLHLPGVDAEREAIELAAAEIADVAGIIAVPGALAFLRALPPDRWAIVTSASRALATARLTAVGVPIPAVLATAEDVTAGKPDPSSYQLAAHKLGFDATDCVVFEDAPAGILAGEAACAEVIVVTATHAHPLVTPHVAIASYDDLTARVEDDGRIALTLKGAGGR